MNDINHDERNAVTTTDPYEKRGILAEKEGMIRHWEAVLRAMDLRSDTLHADWKSAMASLREARKDWRKAGEEATAEAEAEFLAMRQAREEALGV